MSRPSGSSSHGGGASLVQVFSGHSHVVGCLQGQDSLEELQGQSHVGVHILYGVKGGADAV